MQTKRFSLLALSAAALLASCAPPTLPPLSNSVTQVSGEVHLNLTASGAATPYRQTDAAGQVLRLTPDVVTPVDGTAAAAPPVLARTVVAADRWYRLPLPAFTVVPDGARPALLGDPGTDVGEACTAEYRLSTPDARTMTTSFTLQGDGTREDVPLVFAPGARTASPDGRIEDRTYALVYADRDVHEERTVACDLGFAQFVTTSDLDLTRGWNVVRTALVTTPTDAGYRVTETLTVDADVTHHLVVQE